MQSFAQAVLDVELTSQELSDMLPSRLDLTEIEGKEELFLSIPNLAYTTCDEDGNLVGDESNLLQPEVNIVKADGYLNPVPSMDTPVNTMHIQDIGDLNPPSANTQSNQSLNSEHNGDAFLDSYGPRVRGCTSEMNLSTAVHHTHHTRCRYRTWGRCSRYTWYRRPRHRDHFLADTSGDAEQASFSLWQTTRREKAIILTFSIMNLCNMMCISVMAPFFPDEASKEANPVNPTVVGWIFGSFSLTQLFFAPICGKLLQTRMLSARFMFVAGQFFGGSCNALFGLLTYIDTTKGNELYITYCFVLRICASIGCTAASTASFTLTAANFRDQATTVFGILETFSGLGLTLGPALGGALYDYVGFVAPFAVLGCLMVFAVPINMCILPVITEEESDGEASMFKLLCIPSVFVTCLCVTMGGLVWAMLDPILQPHLAQYNISAAKVGLFFLLMCATYALCSPVTGRLCDTLPNSSPVLLSGLILSGFGLLLLGPSTLLGFPSTYGTIWLNLVSFVVLGVAISLTVIPTFDKMFDSCEKAGIDDSLDLYGLIAGLWGATYALGDFAGPTLAGFLTEKFGFQTCCNVIAIGCFSLAVVVLALWLWELWVGPCRSLVGRNQERLARKRDKMTLLVDVNNERTPLLQAGN